MAGDWATVVGTLGGAALGAFAGIAGQRAQTKQALATRWDPSRHEIYANFVAMVERCHLALWQVAYARRHNEPVEGPWREANDRYENASSLVEQVVLLASPKTQEAARALHHCLDDFKREVYIKTRRGEADYNNDPLGTEAEYRLLYIPKRDEFILAAKRELGVAAGAQS